MPTCPEFIQFISWKVSLPYFSSSICCLPPAYSCMQSCTEVLVHMEPTAISISSTSCLITVFLGLLALLPSRLSAASSPHSSRPLISAELSLPVSSPISCSFLFILSFLKCLLFQLGLEFLTTNYFPCFEIPFLLLWLKEALGYCIIYENWILDSDELCIYTCTALNKHIKFVFVSM